MKTSTFSVLSAIAISLGLSFPSASLAQEANPEGYSSSFSSSQRYLVRGYRGFVDGGLYAGGCDSDGESASYTRIGFTTTHGAQINRHIFVGAGLGFQFQTGDDLVEAFNTLMPIYAAFRFDFSDRKVSPFASARVGGFVGLSTEDYESLGGSYLNVNFGVRLRRLNLSVGYENMLANYSIDDFGYGDTEADGTINTFVFRVGVDLGRRRK